MDRRLSVTLLLLVIVVISLFFFSCSHGNVPGDTEDSDVPEKIYTDISGVSGTYVYRADESIEIFAETSDSSATVITGKSKATFEKTNPENIFLRRTS